MAVITIRVGEGLPIEIKRRLAAQLTSAAVDVLEERPDEVTVVIEEVPRDNWATAGELHSERAGLDRVVRPDVEAFFRKSPAANSASKAPRKPPAKPARRR